MVSSVVVVVLMSTFESKFEPSAFLINAEVETEMVLSVLEMLLLLTFSVSVESLSSNGGLLGTSSEIKKIKQDFSQLNVVSADILGKRLQRIVKNKTLIIFLPHF